MSVEGWRKRERTDLQLSERQVAVLGLLAQGRTNREIGEALGMTLDGAKWHVGEIISKLGVGSREEAAEWWRRRRPAVRVSRALAAVSLRWVAAGAGVVAMGGLAVLAVMALGGGDDAPPASEATAEATATPTPVPTERPLTAEEILHRSEEAMGEVVRVRVESHIWERPPGTYSSGSHIKEYSGNTVRFMLTAGADRQDCSVRELAESPFVRRSLGALAMYPDERSQNFGASAPKLFELLGEATVGGEEAWIIRYAFSYPSIEGPILVEDTEWIAKDDFRLLRSEREQLDRYGLVGQIVDLFVGYDEPPLEECPPTALSTVDELRPLTTPRLVPPPVPAVADQPDS